MEIFVFEAEDAGTLRDRLGGRQFDFISVHGNVDAGLEPMGGHGAVHGATSCLGAMTHEGPTGGAAVFAIDDPGGAYGSALVPFEATTCESAAAEATRRALAAADRLGERPEIVWVSATPGTEEEVLAGIEAVVGADIPVLGGSAADNAVAGEWYLFDGASRTGAGVLVSVLFPSRPVSFAYQSGYSPSGHAGRVTRSDGRRVHEIDHRPAMEVYAEWTGGAVAPPPPGEKTAAILSDSTLWPLGREIDQVGSVPFYLLAHPAVAHTGGAMDLFATVETGEQLTLMTGTRQGLIERAGRVASLARATGPAGSGSPPLGALMIYCGGCMLSVRDRIGEVAETVAASLDGAPFLGAFTFGEQGSLLRAGNRHGNLMISCIVFH
ncbi:MAG: FIST N-terminal domain-containing protein [Pseudomonadota bacterium]